MGEKDDAIRLAVGDLLSRAADASNHSATAVLTAFDPSKDRSDNCNKLGGSKFTAEVLDECAQFLRIETTDDTGKLFSNKLSLATRIVLEIESYFPAHCTDCDTDYCNNFDTQTKARCYLCFQGRHNCQIFVAWKKHVSDHAEKLLEVVPKGMKWLCNSCLTLNNPIKNRRSSRVNSVSSFQSDEDLEGMTKNLFSDHDSDLENESDDNDKTPIPSSPTKKLANPVQDKDVCPLLLLGKCPHGISGKTKVNGKKCSGNHPKWCRKYTRYGSDKDKGCTDASKCGLYHTKHCPKSVRHRQCFDSNCNMSHLVGTRRVKEKQNSNKKQSKQVSDNKPSQGRSASRSNKDAKPEGRSKSKGRSGSYKPHKSRARKDSLANNSKSDAFLELQGLLKSMDSKFQNELKSLKDQISRHESSLSCRAQQFRPQCQGRGPAQHCC